MDQNLERKFLAHILKDVNAADSARQQNIDDSFFQSIVTGTLFKINNYFTQNYATVLTITELLELLKQSTTLSEELQRSVVTLFNELELETVDTDINFLIDQFLSYNKNSMVEEALLKSTTLLSEKKTDKSIEVLKAGIKRIETKFTKDVIRSGTIDIDADKLIFEFHDRIANPEKYKGIMLGFPSIDKPIGGLLKGTLAILAGRYKDGKTTVGHQIACNIAKPNPETGYLGKQVIIHCNEGSRELFQARFASRELKIPLGNITKGLMTPDEQQRYLTFYQEVKDGKHEWLKNIFFDEVPITASSSDRVDTVIKQRQDETGQPVSFVLCDYLGRMNPNIKQQNMAQWQSLGIVADELSAVALQHRVAILALAHPTLAASKEAQEGNDINPEDLGLSSAPVKTCDYFFSWVIENRTEFQRQGNKGFARLALKLSRHAVACSTELYVDNSLMTVQENEVGRNMITRNSPSI